MAQEGLGTEQYSFTVQMAPEAQPPFLQVSPRRGWAADLDADHCV